MPETTQIADHREPEAELRSRLWQELCSRLRCPACRVELLRGEDLVCSGCGSVYPPTRGIYRFVSSEHYADSFGFQWNLFARTQLDNESSDESETAFRRKTGFTPLELREKWVLDVGCGMGRFAEVASRWGANVVGIDLSLAAEVAHENLRHRENIFIFQADLFRLPFAPNSFDFIYSIGVLHHTPSCEQAFKALPAFLKPGGKIAVWLYSSYNKYYRTADIYRNLTTRLPKWLLHNLCYVAVPVFYVHKLLRMIPLIGRVLSRGIGYIVPVSNHPKPEWRVLDTFDWYSPAYQSKHTYEEVARWFEECGLHEMRVLYEPIALQGMKLAHSFRAPDEPGS